MFNCSLCPHRCHAERNETAGKGRCRMPDLPRIARAALHHGEEPCISIGNGSGTVFFSGCSLACVFCQNHTISHEDFGKTVTVDGLIDCIKRLEDSGAENINLVNPTHYAHSIIRALSRYRPRVPVIYNSSGFERTQTIESLDGLIDIYLPDYKYSDDMLAKELSNVDNYRFTALNAIAAMLRQVGNLQCDENGKAVKGTMIRHLVLPGHTKNSIDALRDIKDTFTTDVCISLLFQYTPMRPLVRKELNRTLTKREAQKVFDAMYEMEFENGYTQELSSATTEYVPLFDLTGVDP